MGGNDYIFIDIYGFVTGLLLIFLAPGMFMNYLG